MSQFRMPRAVVWARAKGAENATRNQFYIVCRHTWDMHKRALVSLAKTAYDETNFKLSNFKHEVYLDCSLKYIYVIIIISIVIADRKLRGSNWI